MAKRRRTTQSPRQSEHPLRTVYTYEVTTAPIQDRRYRRLPEHVKEAFDRLYHQAQRRPREAIPELLEWVERYPDIPQLYNYLSIAYSAAGQREEAEAMIRENYRRNPDYLFARLNYAELCLAKGDYGEIPEIFDHKFDLKLLYPKRKRFHISEAASFMGLVGIYFFEIEERETAENYYDILKEIAPHHPMAKALRRKLFPGLLRRMLIRLTGRS